MKSRPAQIIVADDDRTVRTVIVQALSRQGYQVALQPLLPVYGILPPPGGEMY